jgi:hypothetical protein
MAAPRNFVISSDTLLKIFQAWSIPLPQSGLVLFALRGALPAEEIQGWTQSVQARLAPLDYERLRCTLGIWDVRA